MTGWSWPEPRTTPETLLVVEQAPDLGRFATAQDGGTWEAALRELQAGRKTGHWIWFVFPQLAGLGRSSTARSYALSGLEEARAYLDHPVLGARLREATAAVAAHAHDDPVQVMGSDVDVVKLRSSMTLFALAAPQEELFARVLGQWWSGEPDPATTRLLGL